MASRMPKGTRIWVCTLPITPPNLRTQLQHFKQPNTTVQHLTIQLLNLGQLNCDDNAWLRGANSSLPSKTTITHTRRNGVMIAVLIAHATAGLLLFDTGTAEDLASNWSAELRECTPRIWSKDTHGLPEAIAATGNDIRHVKAVVLSHLHNDHAGGLEHFFGTETQVWVHEAELKSAFWQAATGIEDRLYSGSYMTIHNVKWRTFERDSFEIFEGITLHRTPGHTEGSVVAELSLPDETTLVLTGDLFHVRENWEEGRPQGDLLTDLAAWHRSRTFVQALVARTKAKVLLGHDIDYFNMFKQAPEACFG